jgi:endonuclease YncB( thermonuclease family)
MTRLAFLAAAGALLLVGACATAPKPLTMEDAIEVSAAVTSVDAAARTMTIRTDAGEEFALDVSPEVRNLPQVQAGDRVVVRYREAIGAAMKRDGDPAAPVVDLSADRAAVGARPGASATATTTVPVRIIAVDTTKNVVTFYDPDQLVRKLEVRRPEAQAWIRQLKPGDEVIVTYTESVALSVEPAAR